MTSKNKLSTGSFSIRVSGTSNRLGGDWQVMPFLSTVQVNTYEGDDKYGYYICADCDPITVTIHAPGTLTYGIVGAMFINQEGLPKNRFASYIGQIINRRTSSETFNIKLGIGYTPDGKHPMKGGVLTNTMVMNIGEIFVPAAASTNEKDQVIVTIASKNYPDGEYDYLDIGPTYAPDEGYPKAVYWTFMQVGDDPIPYESYCQLEQDVQNGEDNQP